MAMGQDFGRLEDLFLAQFLALLQAGVDDDIDLRILAPMDSVLVEAKAVREVLEQAKAELFSEGKAFSKQIHFRVMIEVPSAALLADHLSKEVDFFSIGINDLTQYTLAVDQTNSRVENLANPLNPAVLRLIKNTIDHTHQAGKWVGLCDQLEGEPLAAPILHGFNQDEFNISLARIPIIKQVMRHLHRDVCQKFADEVLNCVDTEEVLVRSQQFLRDLGLDY